MIVIGIDPGSIKTGYGIIASNGNSLKYLGSGLIIPGKGTIAEKLKVIYAGVSSLIEQFKPDAMATEETFLSKNVQSTVKLSEARASAMVAGANLGLSVYEYTPMQIKQAVVGTGGAKKNQVQFMVSMILNLNGTPKEDAADALACAICHANTFRITSQMGTSVANASSVRGRFRSS